MSKCTDRRKEESSPVHVLYKFQTEQSEPPKDSGPVRYLNSVLLGTHIHVKGYHVVNSTGFTNQPTSPHAPANKAPS